MNFTAFNGAGLNGVVNAWVLAVASIVGGGSMGAPATYVFAGTAAATGSAAAAAVYSFQAGGTADAAGGIDVVVQPTLQQAAGGGAKASATVTANVAGTSYGSAAITGGATVAAIPASQFGAADVSGGGTLGAAGTRVQPALASAGASAQITLGASLVKRGALTTLSGSATVSAEPRMNGGVLEAYALQVGTASVSTNELVLMTNAAFAFGSAYAAADATKQQSASADGAGKSATLVTDPGTATYASNPMFAGATAAAYADRTRLGGAAIGPCTSNMVLLPPVQQHFGLSAAQCMSALSAVTYARVAGLVGAGVGVDILATATRVTTPVAFAAASADAIVYAERTAMASAAASASASSSATVTPVQARAAMTSQSATTASATSWLSGYAQLTPSAAMAAAAGTSTVFYGYSQLAASASATAASTGFVRVNNTETAYPYLFNSGAFNSAPLGWAAQRAMPLIAGGASIFADSIANGASIDPEDRTFYRLAQTTAFFRDAQITIFWRPA